MRSPQVLLVSLCLLAGGCASWFMNGGKLVDGGYAPTVRASYTTTRCALVNGTTVAAPPIVYEVVADEAGTGMFERSPDGSGAVLTNQWADAQGDHYFGWVQSNGWEYIIPRNPSENGVRLVYSGLRTVQDGTVTKPASPVFATCPLVPMAPAPNAMPSFTTAAPAAPPSAAACKSHLDCKAGLVCPGGQCVSPRCSADKDCGADHYCSLEGQCEALVGGKAVMH